MLYKNGNVVLADFTLANADVKVSKGRIMEIAPHGMLSDNEREIDISGMILSPAFVEQHIHGCCGMDFSSEPDTLKCLNVMSEYLYSKGTAVFAPAVMTMPYNELCELMVRYQKATVNPLNGAASAGIYLEGPFLSAKKCGAQPADCIQPPDIVKLCELNRLCGGIRIVCVAPEVEGAKEFIPKAAEICRISAAHTEADYDTMKQAIANGISCGTHIFNAMPPLSHRNPGAVAALLESSAYCELICDGVHIHPAVIRLVSSIIGRDRLCIISDAMAATGMGNGVFKLGSQEVSVNGNRATLSDGTIAGSVSTVADNFRNAVDYGIEPLAALQACTLNPAKALGIDNYYGSIAVGKSAEMILLDNKYNFIKNAKEA